MLARILYKFYYRSSGISTRWQRLLTNAGWLVVMVMLLSAVAGLDTRQSSTYKIFAFLFALLVVASGSIIFFVGKFRVRRIFPRYGTVGEPMKYKAVVENLRPKRKHRGIRICEELPDVRPSKNEFVGRKEPGEEKRNLFDRTFIYYRWMWLINEARLVRAKPSKPFIIHDKPVGVDMELLPLRRGLLQLEDIRAYKTDPFGIMRSRRKTICSSESLIILPRRYALPPIDLPGNSQYQQGGVALASSIGQSEEFLSLREYRPGDPMRHIHWRSWASKGKPIVKEFEDEFFPRYALILDTFARGREQRIFEEAVSVAASFAHTVDTKESLLDLMFIGTEAFTFTAGRGVSDTERMLEVLAGVKPAYEQEFDGLEQLVHSKIDQLTACICVLISWDDQRAAFVRSLRAQGLPCTPILVHEPDKDTQEIERLGVVCVNANRMQEDLSQLKM